MMKRDKSYWNRVTMITTMIMVMRLEMMMMMIVGEGEADADNVMGQ